MSRPDAVALLARAPFVHVATTGARGEPMLRALNAAVVDDGVVFHGAPAGEKMEAVGREVVVSAEEVVASIPSYFADPERARPATTLYRSVQVHGTLDRVDDPRVKALRHDARNRLAMSVFDDDGLGTVLRRVQGLCDDDG